MQIKGLLVDVTNSNIKGFFLFILAPPTRLFFCQLCFLVGWLVGCFFCEQGYTKKLSADFHATWMENGLQRRIDPSSFWYGSTFFFSILSLTL